MWKSINNLFRKWILPPDVDQVTGLDYWRNEFFFMICRLLLVSNVTITIFGFVHFLLTDSFEVLLPVILFNPFFLLLLIGRKINQTVRRWGLILLIFSTGLYLLRIEGILGPAFIFFFMHPMLSAIFFGRKEAQISLWINGLILSLMNISLFFQPELQVIAMEYTPLTWLFTSIAFLFLSAVVTNAITRLVFGLSETLADQTAATAALEAEVLNRIVLEEKLKEERESLQVRVDERTSLLARANEDLMKSMKFKDAFFDSIRHEFRTPIHAISGYTDLLMTKSENFSEKQLGYLNRIRESANHLLSVINNILDTTRIQAGMLDIQAVPVSLLETCKNALAYVEGDALRKGVTIESGNCDETINIKADPQRFKQILVNLLENSVKFTPQGGSMGIEVNRNDKGVHLTVWDTGIGIPDEDINHIFEPFFRSDNRNGQDVEGTGLGLSLAKQLVDAHDWTLSVDSEIGQGSRFTIHIPARDVTARKAVLYY